MSSRQRATISGWLNENSDFEITTANIDQLSHLPPPSFHGQADKFLLGLEKDTSFAGEYIEERADWISRGWCINADELREIINFLKVVERIKDYGVIDVLRLKVAPEGWAHLETLKRNVRGPGAYSNAELWAIDHEGTRYLINKGKLTK